MKALVVFLLLCGVAWGQEAVDARVIVCDRADAEHCKTVEIDGRKLLQTEAGGTNVAMGTPITMPNGDFQVYISVRQVGAGSAEVNPKEFSAYFSDAAHTRFAFYDKAAEVGRAEAMQRSRDSARYHSPDEAGLAGTPPPPGSLNSNEETGQSRWASGRDPNAAARDQEQRREQIQNRAKPDEAFPAGRRPEYLYRGKATQGTQVAGLVFFRKPKGSKVKVGPQDALYEIEVPVKGVVFKFR